MSKKKKYLMNFISYILVFCMILTPAEPMGNVFAQEKAAKLTKDAISILVGQTASLGLEGDTIKSVKSGNSTIASVTKDGKVTGKKAGKTIVTVTGQKGKKYACTVTVKTGLNKTNIYLTQSTSRQVKLAGTTIKSVTSSKKEIASVKKKNKKTIVVQAKTKGTTSIKVVGKNKKKYTCKITVETPKLNRDTAVLAKGDAGTLVLQETKQKATFASANSEIATVDSSGKITAKALGEALITVTDTSKKSYTCVVKVEDPKLVASELHMDVRQTVDLMLSGNTQKLAWSTSNEGVASVDANGRVTARANGKANITAKVESGASFPCSVTVQDRKIVLVEDSTAGPAQTSSSDDGQKSTEAPKPAATGKKDDQGDQPGEGDPEDEFYVNFIVSDGENTMEPKLVASGTAIGTLPVPEYEDGKSFLGWYYDSEFTQPADKDDVISATTTLYAKAVAVETEGIPEVEKVTAAEDVPTDYEIQINSKDKTLTAQEVFKMLSVENVRYSAGTETSADSTLASKENNIKVTGSDGVYVLSGRHTVIDEVTDGFEAGSSYKITLPETVNDDDAVLTFSGFPAATREYDISVAAKEQNNLEMKDDVVKIAYSDISGLKDDNGTSLNYIDETIYSVDNEDETIETGNVSGSFELKEENKDLKPGTTVVLYEGIDPVKALTDPESFKDGEDHISYIKITKIEGKVCYFQMAKGLDVLGTPEILPIPQDADLNLDEDKDTCEIPVSELDWSDDCFAEANLSADTTLDEGDYIAFYTGDFASGNAKMKGDYRKVTKIKTGGTTTSITGEAVEYVTVTFEKATIDDIADEGTTHTVSHYDFESEMSDEEVAELEDDIEDQMEESGFAQEAAMYLSKVALSTNKFSELKGLENMEKYNILVTDENGNKFSEKSLKQQAKEEEASSPFYQKYKDIIDAYDQKSDVNTETRKVDVTITSLHADVNFKAKHLPNGLHIEVGEGFDIYVHYPNNQTVNIHVDLTFTQEVDVEFGCDGSIEWGKIAFIKYPKDIVISPSVQLGTYTGFDITTKMSDKDREPGTLKKGEQLSDVYTDIGEEIQRLMNDMTVENSTEAEAISNYITGKYQYLLNQESHLVNLLNRRVKKFKIDVIPGFVRISVSIILRAYGDMDLFGLHFSYLNCKKWIYNLHILSGKANKEVIEKRPSTMDFSVYVMGTLSIRAGIAVELTLDVGITIPLIGGIDIDFAKAGIGMEIGAYIDMSGLFFYHVKKVKGEKKQIYKGTRYTEIGMYLNTYLLADLIVKPKGANVDYYSCKLAEWKWPLKQFGEQEAPINFHIKQKAIKDVNLRQYVKKFVVPSAYYEIDRQNLVTGRITPYTYGDDQDAYGVELSNSDWGYDEKNHIIYLKDTADGMESECEATLYFKKNCLPLSDTMMTRKIHLSWDNYLDGYVITPNTNGGSYVEASVGKKGAKVEKPDNPTKTGYVFDGWYSDEALTKKYTYPDTMPDKSTDIYAKWKPATDTPYLVEYYLENPSAPGDYLLESYEEFTGTTDSKITRKAKEYEGYVTPKDGEIAKLRADGSSVMRFMYKMEQGTYTFNNCYATGTKNDVRQKVYIDQSIKAPEVSVSGYTLTGWKNDNTGEVITVDELVKNGGILGTSDGKDGSYTAQWKVNSDTLYRIEYYVQQTSGAYTVQAVSYDTGAAGDEVKEEDLRNRTVETIVTDANGKETKVSGVADTLFEEKEGNLQVTKYDQMTVDGAKTTKAAVKADGTLVIKLMYSRKSYTITLKGADAQDTNPDYGEYTVYHGGKMALPNPEKDGYTFKGFLDEKNKKVSVDQKTGFAVVKAAGDATYTSAGWTANKYTVECSAEEGTFTQAEEGYTSANGKLSAKFTYDEEKELPAAPVRENYKFAGWKNTRTGEVYAAGQSVKNLATMQGAVVTLVPEWKMEEYTITYDLDGGTIAEGANPDSYTVTDKDRMLDYPVKEGYRFKGWYQDEEKILQIPGGNKRDLTLKATWEEADEKGTFTVGFEGSGGTVQGDLEREITVNEAYGELPVVEKKNTEFLGWYDAKTGGNKIEADTIVEEGKDHLIYARWNEVAQDITYNGLLETDENDNPDSYIVGEKTVIKPASRKGYTFLGWTVDGDETFYQNYTITDDATEAVTLTANWQEEKYKLALYSSSGLYLSKKLSYGASLENITLPRNKGYLLTGWQDKETGDKLDALPETMPDKNLTLQAIWTEGSYQLIVANPGEGDEAAVIEPMTYTPGDSSFSLAPPQKNRKGYDFAGWFTDDSYSEQSRIERFTPVSYSVTIYAKWVPRSYTINLYFNDAENGTDSEEYTYDENKALKTVGALGLKKKGYTFKGWDTDSKAATPVHKDGEIIGKGNNLSDGDTQIVNLYAVWEANKYTIEYEAGVGAGSQADSKNPTAYTTEDKDASLEAPKEVKGGYEFLGWYYDLNGNGKLDPADYDTNKDGTVDDKDVVDQLALTGEEGDRKLFARWAHAGEYSIALKSSTSESPASTDTKNDTTTFTITRTLPAEAQAAGIEISEDPQRVYFRTVNGTAIGGSAVPINFYHVGGQNVFAVFDNEGCQASYNSVEGKQTVTGTQNSDGSVSFDFTVGHEKASTRYFGAFADTTEHGVGNYAQLYNLTGTDSRYYTAEIYRITSTRGNVTGIGKTTEAKRTMKMPSAKIINTGVYSGYTHRYGTSWTFITNHRPAASDPSIVALKDLIEDKDKENYLKGCGSTPKIQISEIECYTNDHETQMWTYIKSINGLIPKDESSKVDQSFHNFGDISDDYEDCNIYFRMGNTWKDTTWGRYDACGISLWGNKCGGGHADVHYTDMKLKAIDNVKPQEDGIAPAATTDYKKGDKVKFSVVYKELIQSTSGITVDTDSIKEYMPLKDVKCTGGEGTNILTFEGTATEDFSNTTWSTPDKNNAKGTNEGLMNKTSVVKGTVKDMKGNG